MKRGPLRVFLKQPGGWRILSGGILVFLLALATLTGSAWTPYAAGEMDLDHQLAPPSVPWLKRLMATDAGLKALERESGGSNRAPTASPGSDEEDLGYLNGGGAAPAPKAAPTAPLGKGHWLGTDRNGRDMLALLVAGARNCFLPGLVACAIALGLGVPLGLFSGYYGGRVRKIVGTFNSTILSMPRLVLILVVICALEPNVYYTMGVLGATLIPRVSGLIATRVRILSNMGFILAAKEAALSDFKILYRHLFWYQNRAVFFIQFSLIMAESILTETTLSYLQFGTKPPEVSWGNIIEGSQMSFFGGIYWITFFPAMAIILAILGFFYLGDGLNARLAFREGR
jgi:peptide/nickel transport system permease protein